MSFMKTAAAALLLLVSSASMLFAQSATGEVRGTVNDPNGAALAGALVKLTNKATKIDFDAKTNEDGFFLFVNVRPGSYSLDLKRVVVGCAAPCVLLNITVTLEGS